jgi:hypothetical protein
VNHKQHEDFLACAWHVLGWPLGDARDAAIKGAGEADTIDDVELSIPIDLAVLKKVLKNKSALCHFQRKDGSGYLWFADPSLGALSPIGEVAMQMARARVSGKSEPMQAACLIQQGYTLDGFRFPSLSRMGAHHAKSKDPRSWGLACHMIQDACMRPHVVGELMRGHQELEDDSEATWDQHRSELQTPGQRKELEALFCEQVRTELAGIAAPTVEDLIRANASWTLQRFGNHLELEDWTVTDHIAVGIRAVASTMRGLQIMKGNT